MGFNFNFKNFRKFIQRNFLIKYIGKWCAFAVLGGHVSVGRTPGWGQWPSSGAGPQAQ